MIQDDSAARTIVSRVSPMTRDQVVNVQDILDKIDDGFIDPAQLITMKTLKVSLEF